MQLRLVTCHDSFPKIILQGTLEGRQCHVRQRKCRIYSIKEWTSLTMPVLLTIYGPEQKRLEEDLCWIIPHICPMTQSVKGLNWWTINFAKAAGETSPPLLRFPTAKEALRLYVWPEAHNRARWSNLLFVLNHGTRHSVGYSHQTRRQKYSTELGLSHDRTQDCKHTIR